MHPSAIEAYCQDTDSQNHILQILVLKDVHCSEHELNKSAFPEAAELLHKNPFQHLHRKSLPIDVPRKRNATPTKPACGRSGRKKVAPTTGPKEPDVPAVFHIGQIMILEDVQLATGWLSNLISGFAP